MIVLVGSDMAIVSAVQRRQSAAFGPGQVIGIGMTLNTIAEGKNITDIVLCISFGSAIFVHRTEQLILIIIFIGNGCTVLAIRFCQNIANAVVSVMKIMGDGTVIDPVCLLADSAG